MAATDVIFRIGTLGVSKANAELGIVVGILIKIAQVVAENIKKADEFSDAWSKLSTSQRKNVQAMDTATKGFLSTVDNIKTAGKLAAAGLQPTEKQMASLATVAAATAKNLGEGPEGATTRLNALTDSLIKGNDRGLKPYGIELDKTKSLSERQAEAFALLEDRANGLTIEMGGLDDQIQAINSEMKKSAGLTYDWFQSIGFVSDALGGIHDNMSTWNKMVVDSNGAVMDYSFSLEGLAYTFKTVGNTIAFALADLLGFNEAAADFAKNQEDLDKARYDAINKGSKNNADKINKNVPPVVKPPKRGGGGGRAPKPDEMTFTPEEVFGGDVDFNQRLYSAEESVKNTEALLGNFGKYSETVDDIMMGMSGITSEAQKQAEETARLIEIENDIPNNLERRLYLLQQENSETDRRYQLLQQIAAVDPSSMSLGEKQEMWDYELNAQKEKLQLLQEEIEYKAALGDEDAKAYLAAQKAGKQNKVVMDLLASATNIATGAARSLFTAMWEGSGASAKAVRKAIAEIMQGMSIEYAVKAVTSGVEAIISLAQGNHDKAAEWAGAAVAAAAAATVCAGAALALGQGGGTGGDKGRNPGTGGDGGGGGAGYYEGSGYGGGQKEESVINIYVEGSMSGLFNNLRVEQRRRNKSGEGGNLGGTF